MKHMFADLIIAWANGARIQYQDQFTTIWYDIDKPNWSSSYTYRIKPERVYPQSTLTFEEAYQLMWPESTRTWHEPYYAPAFQRIADAAVKKYIQETEK